MTEQGRTGVVHVHSSFSHDGRDTPEALHAFAAARGIAFIGLTDHAEDFDADTWETLVADCARVSDAAVRLVPGLEFRFAGYRGLHLLALGLTRWIAPTTPAEFMAMTRGGVAGFTIVAHPVLPRYELPAEVRAGIDAIEVWNASYNTRYLPDPRAIRLLADIRRTRPEVVGVAGLDQHDGRNDRGTRVVLQAPSGDPLAELKAGRFTNRGVTLSFDAHARLGPLAGAGLWAARTGLDLVNAVHERVMRALRR